MRACFVLASAALLLSAVGCNGINLARGGGSGPMAWSPARGQAPQAAYAAQAPGGYDVAQASHMNASHMNAAPYAAAPAGYGGPEYCPPGGYGHGYGYGPGYGHIATHGTPGFPKHPHHMNREYVGPQGPPTAQVAYPYYTIRGPRDFLLDNPPSIGR